MENDLFLENSINNTDVVKLIKMTKALHLELYLTRSYLEEEETDELNLSILAANQASEMMRAFESNKPI